MLEESFWDNFNRFLSDWKYQNSEWYSYDDEDSMVNGIMVVPETELTAGVRKDDIQRLFSEFSNPQFGKIVTPEATTTSSCKAETEVRMARGGSYNRPTAILKNVLTGGKEGEEYVSNTHSVIQKVVFVFESPTKAQEGLGRRGRNDGSSGNYLLGPTEVSPKKVMQSG